MLDIDVAVLHAGQMLHHAVNAFKNVTGNIRIFALNHQINRDVVFSVNVNLFTSPKDTISRLNPGNLPWSAQPVSIPESIPVVSSYL
ncbi:hypothetical protein M5E88_18650 [Akkermansia muciniphila]|nr:hypothetical protein M5E88_18650 [Akkermansia muciniphila]